MLIMDFFGWFLTGSWLISVRALSILSSALFLLALVAIITRVIGSCVCTQVLNKTKCQTHALLIFLAGKSKFIRPQLWLFLCKYTGRSKMALKVWWLLALHSRGWLIDYTYTVKMLHFIHFGLSRVSSLKDPP